MQESQGSEKSKEQIAEEALGPLLHSINYGFPDGVARMIARGVNLNPSVINGDIHRHSQPLTHAAEAGDESICAMLIEAGAQVDALNGSGYTALHVAAGAGHLDACKVLIEAGAAVDAPDWLGETPLFHAIRNGSRELVNLLLERGADPDTRSRIDTTPLHFAVAHQQVQMVTSLLERGVETNVSARAWSPTVDGLRKEFVCGAVTALHVALNLPAGYSKCILEMCQLLTSHGANPSFCPEGHVDSKYYSPLQAAILARLYQPASHFLLECQIDLEQRTLEWGQRSLVELSKDQPHILELLRAAEVRQAVGAAMGADDGVDTVRRRPQLAL